MSELALLVKAIDVARLMKEGALVLRILFACAPILLDAWQKIKVVVDKELADSGVPAAQVATLFTDLLQGLLASHIANKGELKQDAESK